MDRTRRFDMKISFCVISGHIHTMDAEGLEAFDGDRGIA
jgi:hypothetical protein